MIAARVSLPLVKPSDRRFPTEKKQISPPHQTTFSSPHNLSTAPDSKLTTYISIQDQVMNIHIRAARQPDLIHLTRLDLKANAAHPLVSLSFAYPFQATKLFLAHLQYCFDRPSKYRFLVAVLPSNSVSAYPSPPSSDSDSVSSVPDVETGNGEIAGFLVWKEPCQKEECGEGEMEEWDWEARLPKGTDIKLWRHFTESVGADPSSSSLQDTIGIYILRFPPLPYTYSKTCTLTSLRPRNFRYSTSTPASRHRHSAVKGICGRN